MELWHWGLGLLLFGCVWAYVDEHLMYAGQDRYGWNFTCLLGAFAYAVGFFGWLIWWSVQ